jgi:signal recognition particle subunit SRP54
VNEVLLVIDATTGQNGLAQAREFAAATDVTGIVLTKLDGDARGGAALSVRGLTDRPIVFASTGEDLDALEPFYPDRMASRILDLGDILTLIEQAQKNFDEDEAAKVAEKFQSNTFTLADFLEQLQQVRKMGSMKGLLGMMPGAGKMREQIDNFDEKDIDRTEAIIRSMTPLERDNPKLLNGSRRLRIAKGSGMTVTEVNQLITRFDAASKMMKTVARGGTPAIPGMGPMPGGRVKAKAPVAKKGSRSGNPAKRAAENAALQSAPATGGNSFGIGAAPDAEVSESEMETMRRFIERGGL